MSPAASALVVIAVELFVAAGTAGAAVWQRRRERIRVQRLAARRAVARRLARINDARLEAQAQRPFARRPS